MVLLDIFRTWDITKAKSPLYYSVLCGFYDLVKHLAIKHPQHVNAICGRYRFPLFAALSEDHIEVAELLLEHGANVDASGNDGKDHTAQGALTPQRNLVNIVKVSTQTRRGCECPRWYSQEFTTSGRIWRRTRGSSDAPQA
jgi:hypothetical protein